MTRLISSLRKSRYLKRDDVDPPLQLTIDYYEDENVSADGAEEAIKPVVYFKELDPGLVLNFTNAQLIAKATGKEDMDEWSGHRIELYDDPSVSFAGKLVGGIRARAIAKKPQSDGFNDELPL